MIENHLLFIGVLLSFLGGQLFFILFDLRSAIQKSIAETGMPISWSYWWKRNGFLSILSLMVSIILGSITYAGGWFDSMTSEVAYVSAFMYGTSIDAFIKTFKSKTV